MATVTAASISVSDSLERFRQEFNTLRSDVSNITSGAITINNESNNRILTSVSTNTFNAEESLTFDGSTFAVGGAMTVSGLTTLSGNLIIPNAGNIGSAGDTDSIAIASNGVVTFSQAPVFPDGSIAVADLDIDGGTDIGAGLADADLFIVDDGAGGTNRKTAASRIKTYIADVTLTTAAQTNITSLGTLTGLTVSGDVTFTGDSYNAVWDKSDNALEFVDNAKIQMGTSADLSIYHDGSHSYIQDAGTGYLLLTSNGPGVRINSSSAEVMGDFVPDGAVTLYHDNSAKIATTSGGIDVTGTVTSDGADLDGAVVINEGSADVDFRVESNGNTHMLFVDGGNDRVLVGGSSVTTQPSKLQVTGSNTNQITVKSSGGTGYTQGGIAIEGHASDGTPGDRGQGIYYFNEGNDRTYYSGTLYNNGTVWGVGTATGTTLGYDAADNANALFTIASNGNVTCDGTITATAGSTLLIVNSSGTTLKTVKGIS